MPSLRTVVCHISITGTPDFVAQTLARAAVLPDRGKAMPGFGKLSAVLISDHTSTVDQDDLDVAIGRK